VSTTTYLNGLDESEEQDSDADASPQQLDEPRRAEQTEEADVDDLGCVNDAPDHSDEIECVPRVFEVRLQRRKRRRVDLMIYICCQKSKKNRSMKVKITRPPQPFV
jgi:hypothetical protein